MSLNNICILYTSTCKLFLNYICLFRISCTVTLLRWLALRICCWWWHCKFSLCLEMKIILNNTERAFWLAEWLKFPLHMRQRVSCLWWLVHQTWYLQYRCYQRKLFHWKKKNLYPAIKPTYSASDNINTSLTSRFLTYWLNNFSFMLAQKQCPL